LRGTSSAGALTDLVTERLPFAGHGAASLTSVVVDSYSEELRDGDGFMGDRANKRAFNAILEDWRELLRRRGDDPFGDTPSDRISRRKLDKLLIDGDHEAAGLVHGAVEEFAQALFAVIRRFLRLKSWRRTQRIAIGGGFRASRIGEIAIGRAGALLKGEGSGVELKPIDHDPDEAGLIGSLYIAPSWIFAGHDAILAVDIGGTNIRTGIVELNLKKAADLSAARVAGSEIWRYADDKPGRDDAIARLTSMLTDLVKKAAKPKLRLAPFIGVACPGIIGEDGTIKRGGQNLPGNWQSSRFNLPKLLREAVAITAEHETVVFVHNDAVIQGLSEIPAMRDVERWGVLTIGTGLGNARFTNVAAPKASEAG
jgi:hypothetical protein